MTIHSSILAWRIPMDRGAWWATGHRFAKSQTLLKCLSKPQAHFSKVDFRKISHMKIQKCISVCFCVTVSQLCLIFYICVFLLGYFYLLDIKVEVYGAFFIIKHEFMEVNPEWSVLLDFLWVSRSNVHCSPLS